MESLPDEAIQQILSTLSARDLLHAICKSSCGPKPRSHPDEMLPRFIALLAV